jgi:hypothetical protein
MIFQRVTDFMMIVGATGTTNMAADSPVAPFVLPDILPARGDHAAQLPISRVVDDLPEGGDGWNGER